MTIYNLSELWPHLWNNPLIKEPNGPLIWKILFLKSKTRNKNQQNNLSLAKVYSSAISWSFVHCQFSFTLVQIFNLSILSIAYQLDSSWWQKITLSNTALDTPRNEIIWNSMHKKSGILHWLHGTQN